MPQTGKDYPGSYAELLTWFPDEAACLDYLEWLRWPDGFRCPRCVGRAGWRLSSGRWECSVCGRQVSVTAGTIFHRTRTPLRLWFGAAWAMTSQKHGVSALGIQRSLGLGSYQTAWAMLHRYRKAMVRPARERLAGWVEVDEAYLGGVEGGVFGRQTDTKAIVAIAVEIKNPKGFGRIRLQRVDDVSKDSLIPFIESAVEPGATVHTDGWQAYWTVPTAATSTNGPSCAPSTIPLTWSCRASTASRACSSAGCLAPTRGPSDPSTSTPTSTSSRSASTDAAPGVVACSSTDCSSKPSSPTPSPTEA